jgi:hypothetical protein
MCLHHSFENITLLTQTRGVKENTLNYCDGSRNHGCKGCFCRHPNFHPANNGKCKRCGKYLLDLFDLLWRIRKRVYTSMKFEYLDWRQIFEMEIDIEERLNVRMCILYNDARINLSKRMGRSEVLRIFTINAEEVTDAVIKAKEEEIDIY